METAYNRPSLQEYEVRRARPFFVSIVIATFVLALLGGLFAALIIPGVTKPKLLVRVIAPPPSPEIEPQPPTEQVHRERPRPTPPAVQPVYATPPMPSAPPVTATPLLETDFLVNDNANALEAIAQFQADEEQRQQELLEKEEREREAAEAAALLAQEKAIEEKAKREREKVARQLADRQAEAKRAEARALAAQKNEARKATEQAARQARAEADAQRKAAALAQKVVSNPSVSRRTSPSYPRSARRQGVEGTAQIAATVSPSGKVSSLRVVTSSGHRSLDSSALSAVKKWRFKPALNGLGQPVTSTITVPITFRLN